MSRQIIQPQSNRKELLFLLIATLAIFLIAAISITIRKSGDKRGGVKSLKKYQISAFSALAKKEQLLFTSLYAAGFEINNYHLTNMEEWPTVSVLDDDGISPFVRDIAWRNSGSYSWIRKRFGDDRAHIAIYYGRPKVYGEMGNFLITMEHFHGIDGSYQASVDTKDPFRIWYDKSGRKKMPQNHSSGYFIDNEWKEVVTYKGKDEVKRLGRE